MLTEEKPVDRATAKENVRRQNKTMTLYCFVVVVDREVWGDRGICVELSEARQLIRHIPTVGVAQAPTL